MSVATGASRESALQAIDSIGITECFEFIVTADDVKRGKPDPLVFKTVLKKAEVSAEKTLIVEDSLSGVEAALGAGACDCIGAGGRAAAAGAGGGARAGLRAGGAGVLFAPNNPPLLLLLPPPPRLLRCNFLVHSYRS